MPRLLHLLIALCSPLLAPAAQPNILLILTDDLAFSDLGCYGSEIETPTLDRLASNGLRFTQFYNTAKCHSSRVSLLSGRWCRQAGDESLSRAVIIPEVLQPAGYFTAMTGKWHLTKEPTDFGFQRYFGHLSGATNYYKGDKTFRLNGQPYTVPETHFYTTVANVDHALTFLDEARTEKKPWFLYLAFNAPHAPLQPLEADYKKYLGKYDAGWDTMRTARLARQKQLNLFGKDLTPAPRPDNIPAWSTLTPELQNWEARRMAAYAALIDRIDQELGRLVASLKAKDELDNTLILFFSDNGACPYDRRSQGIDKEPYDGTTSWSDSTGWAWARNSPFRYYKQNQFEGGITSPAVVHWPAGLKTPPGSLIRTPAHLVDILPTLADVTGAKIPSTFPGRDPSPLAGVSLKPLFDTQPLPARPPIHLLFGSDRGLRDGDWKLVSFQSEPWELYNLAEDRTELNNLAAKHPDILNRMVAQWHDMAQNTLHATTKETAPVATTATGHIHREWSNYSGKNGADTSSRGAPDSEPKAGKKSKSKAKATPSKIRARTGTQLKIEAQDLVLTCTGNDPGLALEALQNIPSPGPYRLSFRVQSHATGPAELYFTTDSETKLPGGSHLDFEVAHDGEWHNITLTLDTPKTLHGFRLDPCAGPGTVRIQALTLQDPQGTPLLSWP
jgi:arylsulfatase A-like enzyme